MTICQRCHRPLKNPSPSGFGPVCIKVVQPVPEVECDLFGFDIQAAALSSKVRLSEFIGSKAALAKHEIRMAFRDARERLEVRP